MNAKTKKMLVDKELTKTLHGGREIFYLENNESKWLITQFISN